MSRNKKLNWFRNNIEDIQTQTLQFIRHQNNLDPDKMTLKIIIYYIILGALWILLSDKALALVIPNPDAYKMAQLFKGWLYVIFTGGIFYFIILKRMRQLRSAIDRILVTYEELVASHEELMAMEEELNDQYNQLTYANESLEESNKRHTLLIDASNDGIWDFDMVKNTILFSIGKKDEFNYDDGELVWPVDDFNQLVHPSDFSMVAEAMTAYLGSKEGSFRSTYRLKTKTGHYRWVYAQGKAIWNADDKPIRLIGSHTDITDKVEMENKYYKLAYYDKLTGLPNISYLQENIDDIFLQNEGKDLWFLYMDVDRFKHINETMGHSIGDELIKHIGGILGRFVGPPHLAARLSGDEFAILLVDLDEAEMNSIIKNIMNSIREPWQINGYTYFVTVSVGIVKWPVDGKDFFALLQNADIALSSAKEKRNICELFDHRMKEKAWNYVEMETDIRIALEKDEFQLYYQPLYDLASGEVASAEALIRWFHPKKGYISPLDFIPFAEKTGYIQAITKWVFKTVCRQKNIWTSLGYKSIRISINLSNELFSHSHLVERTQDLIESYSIEDFGIELEVTETALISDFTSSIRTLNELKNSKIILALDDFGTGYSSLTYLKELPIDIIKIDRKFISGIGISEKDDNILKHIIDLAHILDLRVVAEGVETKDQLDFLKENKCDLVQGYYYAKPMPSSEFENLLKKDI